MLTLLAYMSIIGGIIACQNVAVLRARDTNPATMKTVCNAPYANSPEFNWDRYLRWQKLDIHERTRCIRVGDELWDAADDVE